MRALVFARRNLKEIVRDPMSAIFGVCLPVVLIVIMTLVNKGVGSTIPIFNLQTFAPGMAVFALPFLSMFVGMLMAQDKSTSFLTRLFASPMRAAEYLAGYALPALPLGIAQAVACFGVAACFGFHINANTLAAMGVVVPVSLLFISLGLLIGTVFGSASAVGGAGSGLVNGAALLGGTFLPLDSIQGGFHTFCYWLPFAHATSAVKVAAAGNFAPLPGHLLWVLAWTVVCIVPAILLFRRKMRG